MATSSDSPPAKRPRTEDTPPSPPDLKRHAKFWFKDGNVVIATEDGVAFRVHETVISLHSRIFNDMFSVPHTGGLDEVVEGCPIIRVSDPSEWFAWLFALLYSGGKDPFFDPDHMIDFRVFRAMLTLAYKYEIEHVRMEALRRLRLHCPTTLGQFDAHYDSNGPGLIHIQDLDMIAVINLARSFDLPEVLPFAFLTLCTMANPEQLPSSRDYGSGKIERLSSVDLVRCLRGVRFFVERIPVLLDIPLMFKPPPTCQKNPECVSRMPKFVSEMTDYAYLPSEILVSHRSTIGDVLNLLCANCKDQIIEKYTEFRQSTWDSMGAIFDIQPWPIP